MSEELINRLREMAPTNSSTICCADRTTREMNADINEAADRIAELEAEVARLSSIVRGWHYLAVGPDEMGDYYTQKQLIKASEPYASPALKAIGGQSCK